MDCRKYSITNNSEDKVFLSYQRCSDLIWEYQEVLEPEQTKMICFVDKTFLTDQFFENKITIVDLGIFTPRSIIEDDIEGF